MYKKSYNRIALVILIVMTVAFLLPANYHYAHADDGTVTDGKEQSVDTLIDYLDLSELDKFFSELSDSEKHIIGTSTREYIKELISGEKQFDLATLTAIISGASSSASLNMSIISLLLAICVIASLSAEFISKNTATPIKKAIEMGVLITMSGIIVNWVYIIISAADNYISDIKTLCDIAFPIFYTLLTTSGATTTAGVMTSGASILTYLVIELIKGVILPLVLSLLAISIVESISGNIRLSGLKNLIKDSIHWILRVSFLVFAAFMSIQGIFAGIKDSVTLRIGKFALGKYVPIIGGYLSDGINYVIAGSILIKNSIGLTSIVLLLMKFLPVIFVIVSASISLKILTAIAEPISSPTLCKIFKNVDECITTLSATIIGITFIYIVFIGIIMLCGNSVV